MSKPDCLLASSQLLETMTYFLSGIYLKVTTPSLKEIWFCSKVIWKWQDTLGCYSISLFIAFGAAVFSFVSINWTDFTSSF